MFPMENPIEYLPKRENCVAARAARAGVSTLEWLYDFLIGNNGYNLTYITNANYAEGQIPELLDHPYTVSALGDGGAHVCFSLIDNTLSISLFLRLQWLLVNCDGLSRWGGE